MNYYSYCLKKAALHIKSLIPSTWSKGNADSYIYKWNRIYSFAKKYNAKTLVETGTYYGLTVDKMKTIFTKIHSIEIDKMLYQHNKRFYKKNQNVKIHLGDSKHILPLVIENFTDQEKRTPIIFWLDGHCSEKETGIGDEYTPIEKELFLINSYRSKVKAIVIIDDARLFTNINYPSVEQILSKMPSDYYNYSVDRDAIIFIDRAI